MASTTLGFCFWIRPASDEIRCIARPRNQARAREAARARSSSLFSCLLLHYEQHPPPRPPRAPRPPLFRMYCPTRAPLSPNQKKMGGPQPTQNTSRRLLDSFVPPPAPSPSVGVKQARLLPWRVVRALNVGASSVDNDDGTRPTHKCDNTNTTPHSKTEPCLRVRLLLASGACSRWGDGGDGRRRNVGRHRITSSTHGGAQQAAAMGMGAAWGRGGRARRGHRAGRHAEPGRLGPGERTGECGGEPRSPSSDDGHGAPVTADLMHTPLGPQIVHTL